MLVAGPDTESYIERLVKIVNKLEGAVVQRANPEETQALLNDAQSLSELLMEIIIGEKRVSDLKAIRKLIDKVDPTKVGADALAALENGLPNKDEISYVLRCLQHAKST